jgi:hypothetical protein
MCVRRAGSTERGCADYGHDAHRDSGKARARPWIGWNRPATDNFHPHGYTHLKRISGALEWPPPLCRSTTCYGTCAWSHAPARRMYPARHARSVRHQVIRRVVDSACEEVADDCGDLVRMGLEREVARIEEMDYGTGNIAPERLSTCRQEKGIVLSPRR